MRRTTKLSGYLIGIGAGVAAVIWLVKDRLLGPEATPVGPENAPAFRVAPGPAAAPLGSDDDLSEIKGIGPVYRARLEQAGIVTFAGLASADATDVASAAQVPDDKAATWVRQAGDLGAE